MRVRLSRPFGILLMASLLMASAALARAALPDVQADGSEPLPKTTLPGGDGATCNELVAPLATVIAQQATVIAQQATLVASHATQLAQSACPPSFQANTPVAGETATPPALPASRPYDVLYLPANLSGDDMVAWLFALNYRVNVGQFDALGLTDPIPPGVVLWMDLHIYTMLNSDQREQILQAVKAGGRLILAGTYASDARIASTEIGVAEGVEVPLTDDDCADSSLFDDKAGLLEGTYCFGSWDYLFSLTVSGDFTPLLALTQRPEMVLVARRNLGAGQILVMSWRTDHLHKTWQNNSHDSPRFLKNLKAKVLDPFILSPGL